MDKKQKKLIRTVWYKALRLHKARQDAKRKKLLSRLRDQASVDDNLAQFTMLLPLLKYDELEQLRIVCGVLGTKVENESALGISDLQIDDRRFYLDCLIRAAYLDNFFSGLDNE